MKSAADFMKNAFRIVFYALGIAFLLWMVFAAWSTIEPMLHNFLLNLIAKL